MRTRRAPVRAEYQVPRRRLGGRPRVRIAVSTCWLSAREASRARSEEREQGDRGAGLRRGLDHVLSIEEEVGETPVLVHVVGDVRGRLADIQRRHRDGRGRERRTTTSRPSVSARRSTARRSSMRRRGCCQRPVDQGRFKRHRSRNAPSAAKHLSGNRANL